MSVTHCVTLANKWYNLPISHWKSRSHWHRNSLLDHQSSRKYVHITHSGCQNIILISIIRGDDLVFTFSRHWHLYKTSYFLSVLFPARLDINGNVKITRTTTDRNTTGIHQVQNIGSTESFIRSWVSWLDKKSLYKSSPWTSCSPPATYCSRVVAVYPKGPINVMTTFHQTHPRIFRVQVTVVGF